MDESTTMDWKSSGLDANLTRPQTAPKSDYIVGADFEVQLDELLFNRMIRLRNLEVAPQGNEPGKIYYDNVNKKYKMWVGGDAGWVDVIYTSTSTSTTPAASGGFRPTGKTPSANRSSRTPTSSSSRNTSSSRSASPVTTRTSTTITSM